MRVKRTRQSLLLPLALVAVGIALLLNNFLLLSGFNVTALWPLLLVIAGAQILLRGDLLAGGEARTFGITRGSVESATLEVSAGEIDIAVRALQREGRLIAGQYAADSRPELLTADTHATLRLDRAATPWLSFSDWDVGLSPDLPWEVFISTSLGQARLDLSGVIVADAVIASGIGDIHVTTPQESLGAIQLRSALGNIHVSTPNGCGARITVRGGRLFSIHADGTRYDEIAPNVFLARDAADTNPIVDIEVRGTFGDAYLT